MKKYILIAIFVCMFGLAGNATAFDAQYWHDFTKQKVMYKSWDHFWFSVWGYRNPTAQDAKRSAREHWWGESVVVKK